MCNVDVVSRIKLFLSFNLFLRGDWDGFGHPGHLLATPRLLHKHKINKITNDEYK